MNTYSKSSVHPLEKKLDSIYNKNEWYSVYSLYKVGIPHEYLKTKRTITRKIEAVITWIWSSSSEHDIDVTDSRKWEPV